MNFLGLILIIVSVKLGLRNQCVKLLPKFTLRLKINDFLALTTENHPFPNFSLQGL